MIKFEELKSFWEEDSLEDLWEEYRYTSHLAEIQLEKWKKGNYRAGKRFRRYLRINKHLSDEIMKRTRES